MASIIYFCIYYLLLVRCLILNQIWLNQTQRRALLFKNNFKALTSDTIHGIICEEFSSRYNNSRFNELNNIFNNLSLQLLDDFFLNEKNIYPNLNFENIASQNTSKSFHGDFQRKLNYLTDGIVSKLIDTNTPNIRLLLEAFVENTSLATNSRNKTTALNQYTCPNTLNNGELIYWQLKNSIKKIISKNKNKEMRQQNKIYLSSNEYNKLNRNISLDNFLDNYLSKLLNNYFMSLMDGETNGTINNEVFEKELNNFVASDEDIYSVNDTQSFENFVLEVVTNEVEYITAYKNYEKNIKLITKKDDKYNKHDSYNQEYSDDLVDEDNDVEENTDTQDFDKRANRMAMMSITIPFEMYECWYGHNKLRVIHQVRRVVWDKELANGAQEWALHLAIQNKGSKHSSFFDEKGRQYGENLYRYKGAGMKHCRNAIFLWHAESEGYSYKKSKNIYASGHFMQVVWKKTRRFGVGIAYAHDQTWIVARYFPPSNTRLEKIGENVKKRRPELREGKILENKLRSAHRQPRWLRTIRVKSNGETDCQDYHVYCNYYKRMGKCSEKARRTECPKACRVCTTGPRINGGFTKWIKAETCSTDCGVGWRREHRYCVNPEPMNGGAKCKGKRFRRVKCKDYTCIRSKMSCMDKDPNCFDRLKKGHCKRKNYKAYMRKNCEMSCGRCKNCKDNFDEDKCVKYVMDKRMCHIKSHLPFISRKCQAFCCEINRFFLTSGKPLLKQIGRLGSRL